MEFKALYIEKNFNTFKETYIIEKKELDYECSYELKNNEKVLHSLDSKYLIDENIFKEFLNEINKIYKKVVDSKIMFEETNNIDNYIIHIPDLNIEVKGKYEINSLITELIDYVKDNFIYLSKQENGNVLSNNISFKLKTQDNTYNLSLIKVDDKNASLSYVKQSDISKLGIGDVVEYIPIDKYNYFLEQLMQITYNWKNTYNAEIDKNIWELSVSTDTYNLFVEGNGGYPNNWNKLIDLIVEYELIFKKSKKKDEKLILINYFKEELNVFTEEVEYFINELYEKHKNIFNEFVKSIKENTYDFLYPIEIKGYNAKMLNEIQPEATRAEIYYTLLMLENGFEQIDDIINDFKIRLKKCESEIKEEVQSEVDKIMLEQGIITENDIGKNVSILGKVHIYEGVKKRLLKERYNIDFKTFNERHPNIIID